MTSTRTPAWETRDTIVNTLRGDATVSGLLFPDWAPQLDAFLDLRVYDVHAELPPDPTIRAVLPRINVDATWMPDAIALEQRSDNLRGAVGVWIYALVPPERKGHGEQLLAAAVNALLSTGLSGARIIAADLYPTGSAPAERVSALNGAWQFRCEFRSAEVEVLV